MPATSRSATPSSSSTVVTFDATTGDPTIVHSELAQYANAVVADIAMNSGTIDMDGVTNSSQR